MAVSSPSEALALLEAGNARFVAGTSRREVPNPRSVQLEQGQRPHSVVLGCSDSRVPIELIFDQEPGDVFVVRVAGNYLNADNLGSIEFGVANLGSKLVLILGHTHCGAASAAVAFAQDGAMPPGHIANIVTALTPAAEAARDMPGDWIANTVAENVRRTAAALTESSPIIAKAVQRGALQIAAGIYHIGTGKVAFD